MSEAVVERGMIGRLLPAEGAGRALALAGLALAGTLVLWASAKISVPFWPVPMTLQTGAVALLAVVYGWRLGLATVLLYLAEGAAGMPVFQGTPQGGIGLAYMIGPTGGFLLGFIPAVMLIGWLAERRAWRRPLPLFLALLAGDAVIFLCGFVWLAALAALPDGSMGIGASRALAGGVVPFLLGDLFKMALVTCLVIAGTRTIDR